MTGFTAEIDPKELQDAIEHEEKQKLLDDTNNIVNTIIQNTELTNKLKDAIHVNTKKRKAKDDNSKLIETIFKAKGRKATKEENLKLILWHYYRDEISMDEAIKQIKLLF